MRGNAIQNRQQKQFASTRFTMMCKRAEFLAVQTGGIKRVSEGVVFQARHYGTALPATARGGAGRIGFTASRKVGNAVRRNRAKRRMRAWAQHYLADYYVEGADYVLIARARLLSLSWTRFVSTCNKAAEQVQRQLNRHQHPHHKPD